MNKTLKPKNDMNIFYQKFIFFMTNFYKRTRKRRLRQFSEFKRYSLL